MTPAVELSTSDARSLAVAAQGLRRRRPAGGGQQRHVRQMFGETRVVQLDAINVVERSQFLVLFSRLGPFDTDLIHRMNGPGGKLFEYWAHAASLLPVVDEPLFRWRMAQHGPRISPRYAAQREAWTVTHGDYIERVRREIADRGPLAASQLSDPRRNDGEWWGRRSLGRQALEHLFASGELAGWRLPNFERIYDLRERVIPDAVLALPTPARDAAQRALLELAARALGVATVRDLADYYRIVATEARPRVYELVEAGALVEVAVEGWREPGYVPGDGRPSRRGRQHATLLSPFDSLIWNRPRTLRLFGFDFRLEVYVPQKDRRHGYFVLPLLVGDELVARFDLKADRARSVLQVRSAYIEEGADRGEVAEAAAVELHTLRAWLGLDATTVAGRGDFAASTRAALVA